MKRENHTILMQTNHKGIRVRQRTELADIKYYYCDAPKKESSVVYKSTLWITPRIYFENTGFVLDAHGGVLQEDLPTGFEEISDSLYGVKIDNYEEALLKQGKFMYRDMVGEIAALYKRRRLRASKEVEECIETHAIEVEVDE